MYTKLDMEKWRFLQSIIAENSADCGRFEQEFHIMYAVEQTSTQKVL
jgi:hypothetical protein